MIEQEEQEKDTCEDLIGFLERIESETTDKAIAAKIRNYMYQQGYWKKEGKHDNESTGI
jgi:SOS response regulatory protein OraA/RecX